MYILALVTDGFGAQGGIAQYNKDLLTALINQGQPGSLAVIVRNGVSAEAPEKINQLPAIKNKFSYSLKSFFIARKLKPQWLFCGHLNLLPLAWVISRFYNIPVWLQLHGIDAWQPPSCLIRKLVSNVQLVTCVSRYTRRRFLQWANIKPEQVKVLPNTCATGFKPTNPEQIKKELGIENKKIILTVGRLSDAERYKGHDRIIACLPHLVKHEPDLCYVIAGDGSDRHRLEQLAEKLQVSSFIKFVGNIPFENLNDIYSAADLFAMPSTGEGFGIVYLESMACGTPTLGFNVDGSIDPLQDGQLGIITTEEGLCDALLHGIRHGKDPALVDKVQNVFGFKQFQSYLAILIDNILLNRLTGTRN